MKTKMMLIPCLSGAPWDLDGMAPLAEKYDLQTYRLDDRHRTIEEHADDLLGRIGLWDEVILVGDSFGANVALAAATRRPRGLKALVLSGGFASNPVTNFWLKLKINSARFAPGWLYRQLVVRLHAKALASHFDEEGGWCTNDTISLFLRETSWRGYVNRTQAALKADYRNRLSCVQVPTLVLTPEDDRLIGAGAAQTLVKGIPNATEKILERTGHMFRYSHPGVYAHAIASFLS